MPKLNKTASTSFTPAQLFDLVLDVKKYPDFLPFCSNTQVYEDSESYMRADMSIGYKGFSGTFQSNIHLSPSYRIHIEQTHGGLKHLKSEWLFEPTSTGSTVQFNIDFEPKSWILCKLISPILEETGDIMLSAFIKRAKQLYSS